METSLNESLNSGVRITLILLIMVGLMAVAGAIIVVVMRVYRMGCFKDSRPLCRDRRERALNIVIPERLPAHGT
jgi:hypothetical protein